jgi:hypothetical protein
MTAKDLNIDEKEHSMNRSGNINALIVPASTQRSPMVLS